MNARRILDAVWCMCDELARREAQLVSLPWTLERVMLEASGCILASQVPHPMAVAALDRLAEQRLLPPSNCARFDSQIALALRSPLSDAYPRAYRFPVQAARRLVRLAAVCEQVGDIVLHYEDFRVARRSLMAFRCGLGAKQASLLLRNVRIGADLAVLDVHVLAFMRIVGLTTATKVPAGVEPYEDLEDRFRTYAHGLRMPTHRLDVAAWIVMRASRATEMAWAS